MTRGSDSDTTPDDDSTDSRLYDIGEFVLDGAELLFGWL